LHARNKAASIPRMREADDRRSVDGLGLRSLRMLATLLEERSVTRTAEAHGLSQPAASRAVARLRAALGDPLLVRTRRGYALTPRAEALRPAVAEALAAVGRLFEPAAAFEPASSTRAFRVAATDYGSVVALADAAERFAAAAPRARLDVTPWGPDTLERLERGGLNLALYADGPLPPDFHYRALFADGYACLVREGHPLASGPAPPEPAAIAAHPRAVVMFPDGDRGARPDDVLADLFGAPADRVALRTPYFMATPWVVARTDLVACVPRRAAERMAAGMARLAVLPLPAEPFGYRVIWHARAHRDPAVRWLRGLIADACRPAPAARG
jgi:DNA-binding transcriptional LysR family regulator